MVHGQKLEKIKSKIRSISLYYLIVLTGLFSFTVMYPPSAWLIKAVILENTGNRHSKMRENLIRKLKKVRQLPVIFPCRPETPHRLLSLFKTSIFYHRHDVSSYKFQVTSQNKSTVNRPRSTVHCPQKKWINNNSVEVYLTRHSRNQTGFRSQNSKWQIPNPKSQINPNIQCSKFKKLRFSKIPWNAYE